MLAKYVESSLLSTFLNWSSQSGKPLRALDFLSSYGNTLLAITNCFHKQVRIAVFTTKVPAQLIMYMRMTVCLRLSGNVTSIIRILKVMFVLAPCMVQDYAAMWGSEATCYTLSKPRQFPCTTWATDLSENAIKYGIAASIFDEGAVLDLNSLDEAQEAEVARRCREANILHINSLCYLNDGVFEKLVQWFSEGSEPGVFIVGFIYPYDGIERMRNWKKCLLQKLQFYDTIPCKNRCLYASEGKVYGEEYGVAKSSFLDIWLMFRK